MDKIYLKRIETGDFGTFGVLIQDGPWRNEPFALTLEPPWRDNEPFVSCIPAGTYTCMRVNSPKFKETWQVKDVAGRIHILFHKGNLAFLKKIFNTIKGVFVKKSGELFKSNTKGCILVGEEFGMFDWIPGILSSSRGFKEFMYRTRNLNCFQLVISEHY